MHIAYLDLRTGPTGTTSVRAVVFQVRSPAFVVDSYLFSSVSGLDGSWLQASPPSTACSPEVTPTPSGRSQWDRLPRRPGRQHRRPPETYPDDFEAEVSATFVSVEKLLAGVGLGLQDVVRCVCYLTDLADFADMEKIFREIFPTNPPVRATVGVASLARDCRAATSLRSGSAATISPKPTVERVTIET